MRRERRSTGARSKDATNKCCIALAGERRPELLIADYRLVDGTGVLAVRTIDAVGRIPTVSACAMSLDVLREVPDAIVVTKPFSFEELRAAVAKARLYARMVD